MPTLIDVLSHQRFETYKLWASNDEALAVRLYSFNVQLSTALYGPLHMLEVALRNVIDKHMTAAFGVDWLDDPGVLQSSYQQGCVTAARTTLAREHKPGTHSQLVAELNFGFWSSLFGRESNHLWGTLRPMFLAKGVQRGAIASQLRDLRVLRNRIALRRMMHLPIPRQGKRLWQILSGWLAYHAAPTNFRALQAFRDRVTKLWRRVLSRRSQKGGITWERMRKIADEWLPRPRILHPWPRTRFAVKHQR